MKQLGDASFLVTGGAGFIGSHLAARLAEMKAKEVRILDDLSTGFVSNIAPLLELPNVRFIEGDIRDASLCREACAGIDYVLHHAALGSVSRSIQFPEATHSVNVDGFFNMLDGARREGVRRFIYASSSSVYGDDAGMPKTEERTGQPLSPYAVSKALNEAYARTYSRVYGMETVGLRYFNVFGPQQNILGPYAAVIPIFVTKMLANERPSIFGDGKTTRDFTYVENVVQANLDAVFSEKIGAAGHVFNIACGDTIALNDLYHAIAASLNYAQPPEYLPERKGDIRSSWADISKAKEWLGYAPVIGWREGLERTVSWYRQTLGNAR